MDRCVGRLCLHPRPRSTAEKNVNLTPVTSSRRSIPCSPTVDPWGNEGWFTAARARCRRARFPHEARRYGPRRVWHPGYARGKHERRDVVTHGIGDQSVQPRRRRGAGRQRRAPHSERQRFDEAPVRDPVCVDHEPAKSPPPHSATTTVQALRRGRSVYSIAGPSCVTHAAADNTFSLDVRLSRPVALGGARSATGFPEAAQSDERDELHHLSGIHTRSRFGQPSAAGPETTAPGRASV